MRRRLLILGGVALAGGGLWWIGSRSRGYALGPPQLMSSALRTSIGGEDRLLVLTRRSEREIPGPLSLSSPTPGERIELRGFDAATMRPRFTSPLVSMGSGQNKDAAILGEQAGTVWLFIDGLGAASAVDGQLLADTPGLQRVNPLLQGRLPASRDAYRMEQTLVVSAQDGTRWRIDPRRFTASMAMGGWTEPPPPVQHPAAPWSAGPPAFRIAQARIGERWLGVLPARSTEADVAALRFASARLSIAMMRGEPLRLWRGEVRMGSLAPPGWPEKLPDRWGVGERVFGAAEAEIAPGGMLDGGFLTLPGAQEPLRLADPVGVLLLYRAQAAATLRLARLDRIGAVLWQAALPIAEAVTVLPGETTLVIAGRTRAGDANTGALVAIELGRGRVAAYDVAAETALAA